jgi:hypothetical protein
VYPFAFPEMQDLLLWMQLSPEWLRKLLRTVLLGSCERVYCD